MPKAIPIEEEIGKRYGRLTVVSLSRYDYNNLKGGAIRKRAVVLCSCDCGKEKAIDLGNLKSGHSKSCGCFAQECRVLYNTVHGDGAKGKNKAPEYETWNGIRRRCYNKKCKSYEYYGAKGITVCDRWVNNYTSFLQDMGRRPSAKHTIDRIDPSGNYSPENCRWVTRLIQNRNKSNNFYIEYKGETKTLSEWALLLGIKAGTIRHRIKVSGWSIDDTFTRKVRS